MIALDAMPLRMILSVGRTGHLQIAWAHGNHVAL